MLWSIVSKVANRYYYNNTRRTDLFASGENMISYFFLFYFILFYFILFYFILFYLVIFYLFIYLFTFMSADSVLCSGRYADW